MEDFTILHPKRVVKCLGGARGGGGDLTVPQFRASPPEHFTACTEWSSAQNNYAKGVPEKGNFKN
jgi:hypothetical protein